MAANDHGPSRTQPLADHDAPYIGVLYFIMHLNVEGSSAYNSNFVIFSFSRSLFHDFLPLPKQRMFKLVLFSV